MLYSIKYHGNAVRCIPLNTRTTSLAGVGQQSLPRGMCHHSRKGLGDRKKFLYSMSRKVNKNVNKKMEAI